MNTISLSHSHSFNHDFLNNFFAEYISAHNNLYATPTPSRNFTYKLGKASGKVVNYFKKKETKARTLITYWAVETVLFVLVFFNITSFLAFASALFLYLYGTYALFSAVSALTK